MEIGLETPSARAELRAAYGGLFGGAAAAFAVGARRPALRQPVTAFAAIVLGVFSFGRLLSLAVDGPANTMAQAMQALEGAGFVAALGFWWRGR